MRKKRKRKEKEGRQGKEGRNTDRRGGKESKACKRGEERK